MLFSQASEYGLRAAIELARCNSGEWLLAGDLAQRLDIPSHYLAKILQSLVKRGILESQRGRQGGFKLGRPASKITAWDIVAELEDVRRFEECIIGERTCSEDTPCPFHEMWKEIRKELMYKLEHASLNELASFGK